MIFCKFQSDFVSIPGRCFSKDLSIKNSPSFVQRPCLEKLRLGNGMGDKDGFCQSGLSDISFSKNSNVAYIGSPGRNYGQGQMSKHQLHERLGGQRMLSTSTFENYTLLGILKKQKYREVSVGK